VCTQVADRPETSAAREVSASADDLADIYDGLIAHGFQTDDIQAAMESVAHPTMETALDWLCMHVPPARMPKRFEGVRVIVKQL
jgi:hypothetical protein